MSALETIRGHRVRLYHDLHPNQWVFWCQTHDLTQTCDTAADGVRALIAHTQPLGVSVGAALPPVPATVPPGVVARAH